MSTNDTILYDSNGEPMSVRRDSILGTGLVVLDVGKGTRDSNQRWFYLSDATALELAERLLRLVREHL